MLKCLSPFFIAVILFLLGAQQAYAQPSLGRKLALEDLNPSVTYHFEPLAQRGFALVGSPDKAALVGKHNHWEITFLDTNLQPKDEPLKFEIDYDGGLADMLYSREHLYILLIERKSMTAKKKMRDVIRVNVETRQINRLTKEPKTGYIVPSLKISNGKLYCFHVSRKKAFLEQLDFNDETQKLIELSRDDKQDLQRMDNIQLHFDSLGNGVITTDENYLEIRSGKIPKKMSRPNLNGMDIRNLYGVPLKDDSFLYLGNYSKSKKDNGYFIMRRDKSGEKYRNFIPLEKLQALTKLINVHAKKNKDEKSLMKAIRQKTHARQKPVQWAPDGDLLITFEILVRRQRRYDFIEQFIAQLFLKIDPVTGALNWHGAALVNGFDAVWQDHDGYEWRQFSQHVWNQQTGEIEVFAKDVEDKLLITNLNTNKPNYKKMASFPLRSKRDGVIIKETKLFNDIYLKPWYNGKLLLMGIERDGVNSHYFIQEIISSRQNSPNK